jgi:hypothetical protein
LIDHDCLWFAKMKVKGEGSPPPPEPVARRAKKAGFARRGADALSPRAQSSVDL